MHAISLLRIASHVHLALLVAVHLLANYLLFRVGNSFTWAMVATSLVLSQAALLITWGICGPLPLLWRIVPVAGLGWLVATQLAGYENPLMWRMSVVMAASLAAGLLAGQIWLKISRIDGVEPPPERLRFSLRSLLILTTLVAIAIPLGRTFRNSSQRAIQIDERIVMIGMGITLAMVAWLAVWAVLLPGRPWLRMIVAGVLTPLIGAIPAVLVGKDDDLGWMIAWHSGVAAIVALSLLFLRGAGYRWVRRRGAASIPT